VHSVITAKDIGNRVPRVPMRLQPLPEFEPLGPAAGLGALLLRAGEGGLGIFGCLDRRAALLGRARPDHAQHGKRSDPQGPAQSHSSPYPER